LGSQSLRGDEGLTYVYSERPLAEMLEIVTVTSPHPPLYYALMHGWLALAGGTEYALRFPSVIVGVLLVAAVASLGRLVLDSRLGVVAAFLAAVNAYQIFYAQDARSYPLITLLGVLSTVCLWRALRGTGWRAWLGYAALITLAAYTHYYFFLVVGFQAAFVAWQAWQRRRFPWPFVAVGAAVALLYLPWIVLSWGLLTSYRGAGERPDLLAAMARPLLAFSGGQLLASPVTWLNGLSMAFWLGLGAVGLWRTRRPAGLLVCLYLATPLVLVYLASRFKRIFDERYLILASPAYLLLVGFGLVWLFSRRRGLAAVWRTAAGAVLTAGLLGSGLLALANYYFDPEFAKSPPWSEVLATIARKAHPGDALIYTAPLPPILYYNAGRLPSYLIPYDNHSSVPDTARNLQEVLGNHPRVWLIPTDLQQRAAAVMVEPWLDRHGARLDQVFFRQIHIGLYESPTAFFQTMTRQAVRFGDGISLNGFRLAAGGPSPFVGQAGRKLPLTLVWQAQRQPAAAYTVFTHLVGPDGQLWGQWDNPPVSGSYPTDEWSADETVFDPYLIPIKEDAPAGSYRLLVGLYDSAGTRLPVLNDQGEAAGDHVELQAEIVLKRETEK
jgi:hypothetical protein